MRGFLKAVVVAMVLTVSALLTVLPGLADDECGQQVEVKYGPYDSVQLAATAHPEADRFDPAGINTVVGKDRPPYGTQLWLAVDVQTYTAGCNTPPAPPVKPSVPHP